MEPLFPFSPSLPGAAMSIRTKVVLIVFLLLAIVGAAFVAYSVNTTANYKQLRMNEVQKTIEFASETVNKSIAMMERNAKDLANAGRILYISESRTDAAGENIVLENFASFPASVGGGLWFAPYAFNPDRRLSCYYALREKGGAVRIDPAFASEKYDYPNQMWYYEISLGVWQRYATRWTPPYYDGTGSFALMTTVGAGIFDDKGMFVGMSTVDWEIEDVIRELTGIQPTPNSFVLLAAPREDYVISNTQIRKDPQVGTRFSRISWLKGVKLPTHGDVSISRISIGGAAHIVFNRIMANDWLLCVPVPENEIFAEIENRNARFARILGLSSLALLALAWYLVHALVNKPVRRFIADVEELGRGNLDVRIDVRRKDEIGRLGAAFNKMTVDLRESIEKRAKERSERDRIAGELNVATRIQTGMLPCTFPAFPERDEFDIYATMLPAKEVGGDFYDFFMVDEKRLAVVIADVSGKGIPAALFMVIARTLLKNNAQYGKSPSDVFHTVNDLLCENNEAGMFVTVFMGYLELDSGCFTYVNAGHNPPLLQRAGGEYEFLATTPGLFLAAIENIDYREESIVLAPGDSLYLYTDGVTEAQDLDRDFFENEGLLASLARHKNKPLRTMLTGIKADIDEFAGGMEQSDDITMLALRMGQNGVDAGLCLDARLDNLYPAQDYVAERLKEGGWSDADVSSVILAVEEVFVNIVSYAYPDGKGDVALRVEADADGGAVLTIKDSGVAFNPLEKDDPDLTEDLEDRALGGFGVFMVKQIMDKVTYRRENGKNILVMWKRPKKEGV